MKELIINGRLYAKYEFVDKYPGILFLKMIIKIYPLNETLSENFLADVITGIEGKKIHALAYLNV